MTVTAPALPQLAGSRRSCWSRRLRRRLQLERRHRAAPAAGSRLAPANPLRGLAADSAYLASVVNQIDGPVLLVGHSYGGAVITNAAPRPPTSSAWSSSPRSPRTKDETLGDVAASSKDSLLGPALVQRQYPTGRGGETAPEFPIDPARFREVFAADLPAEQAAVLAATQRPVAAAAFGEVSGPPAWKTSRPGRWSPPPTRPPAATSSVPWPSAPAPRSSRSTPRTWS